MKPQSRRSLCSVSIHCDAKDIRALLNNWIEMLRKYDEVETFYDDPIIKSYAESYYSCFNITDEYANKPLSPKHILLLDEYLEFVEKKIDNYATDNNRAQIEDIKENVRSLKNKLTSEFGQVICNSLAYI